jgi:Domain of unknown function (DUF4184)
VPFTGSHPAAVLPFLRTPLPASALVIGSLAPDLPYYLPVPLPEITHTAPAVVTVDLLIGALAWVVWHGLLSAPALATAPTALRGRLAGRVHPGLRERLSSPRRIALVVAALVVGAATHVGWDEFTHADGWGTAHLPLLTARYGRLPGYQWGQYAGSLAGGAVLLLWAARWWRRAPARPVAPAAGSRWCWPVLGGIAVLAGAAPALRSPDLSSAVFAGATWGGGAALAAALVLALLWRTFRAPGTLRGPRST